MAYPLKPLRVEVVSTGNELLDGSISDTNSQRLANALRPLGLKIAKTTIVSDSESEIIRAVTEAVLHSDVIVVSGGLGPTSDDLTLEVLAKCFGEKLVLDSKARKNVLDRLKFLNRRKLNPGHKKQFFIPKGSKALSNLAGTAPGVEWKIGDRVLFSLPGVPREYQFILDHHLLPFFAARSSGLGEHLFIYKVFGWPESALNELFKKIKVPAGVTVGYRTHLPENHIKLQVSAASRAQAAKKVSAIVRILEKKLGSALFSDDQTSFEEGVLKFLQKKKWKLALAESCTGGLAASMITRVAGSSAFFERGFVTYSNASKQELLGVREETLKNFGAVSEQTAKEMAEGARKRAGVDVAISITGIAGPSGGTKQKPVGMVWMAASTRKGIRTKLIQLPWDRELNQKFSAYYALQMLREL